MVKSAVPISPSLTSARFPFISFQTIPYFPKSPFFRFVTLLGEFHFLYFLLSLFSIRYDALYVAAYWLSSSSAFACVGGGCNSKAPPPLLSASFSRMISPYESLLNLDTPIRLGILFTRSPLNPLLFFVFLPSGFASCFASSPSSWFFLQLSLSACPTFPIVTIYFALGLYTCV